MHLVEIWNLYKKYLHRKRDISGDDLRREFWVHEEASSPKKKKKAGRRSFVMIGPISLFQVEATM